jgi:hypothetical protein
MRESERRQFIDLVRCMAKKEVAEALSQHLAEYEHQKKEAKT